MKQGLDWYTIEGPFTLRVGDRYVCFYSGGRWENPNYGVGYLLADRPMGDGGLEDRSWSVCDDPNGPRILKTRDARECTDVRAPSEWLTASDVAAWLGYSKRTARRYMHDGTWREGEHWFRNGRSRPRFRRSALEAWLRTPHRPSAPALGLAFGADIPPGRRRRLTSLRNKGTSTRNGATEGAEADGAAGGVPGAGAAHGAARSG